MRIAASTLALAMLLPTGCVEPRPTRSNTQRTPTEVTFLRVRFLQPSRSGAPR